MVATEIVWKEFKLLFWSEDSSALSLFLMWCVAGEESAAFLENDILFMEP